jgi:phosphatidylserine decarboxylase
MSQTERQPSVYPHAKPFLGWLAVIGAVCGIFQLYWLTGISAALFLYVLYFFRAPRPSPPDDPRAILAPAHGTVADIIDCDESSFIKGSVRRVGIFLSIFDVHVQACPTDASIKWTEYRPGKFLDARDPACSTQNECQWLGFESRDGFRYTVKLIAGLIARRIVLWRPKDKPLRRGDRISLIRFGSRVEIFLPKNTEVLVKVGDRVKGGESIVARRP